MCHIAESRTPHRPFPRGAAARTCLEVPCNTFATVELSALPRQLASLVFLQSSASISFTFKDKILLKQERKLNCVSLQPQGRGLTHPGTARHLHTNERLPQPAELAVLLNLSSHLLCTGASTQGRARATWGGCNRGGSSAESL